MIFEAVGGILAAFAILAAAVLLAHLPRKGPGRETPPGRSAAGLVAAATKPHSGPAREITLPPTPTREPSNDQVDPPAGIRMAPLDLWDVLTVSLILVMALAAPVIGPAVAVLVIPTILIGLPLAIRALFPDLLPTGKGHS